MKSMITTVWNRLMKRDHWDTRALDYLNGTLSVEESRAFEQAMQSDSALKARVQSMRTQIALLKALPAHTPGEHVWRAVQTRRRSGEVRPQVEYRLPVYRSPWRLAPVAASVVLLLASMAVWQPDPVPVSVIEVAEANGFGDEAELLVAHHSLDVDSPSMRRSLSMLYPDE